MRDKYGLKGAISHRKSFRFTGAMMEAVVARYYMQLRDGNGELLDPEGLEHADIDALKKEVLLAVRALISEDVKGGEVDLRFRIDAEDREGVIVYTLGFAKALNIIPEGLPHGGERG